MPYFFAVVTFLVLFGISSLSLSTAQAVSGGIPIQNVQSSKFGFLRIVENKLGSCTGVLVEPTLVLTSAHCIVDNTGRPHKISVKRFQNDPRPARGVMAYVHKKYVLYLRGELSWTINDLAAIVIDDSSQDSKPRVALTPIDYLWELYKKQAEAKNKKAWFPKFLEIVTPDHIRKVLEAAVQKHSDGRVSALLAGFGLGDCRNGTCSETFGVPKYIGKYLYNAPPTVGYCTKERASFLNPNEQLCTISSVDETTTPILDPSITIHDTRKGDSGGPLFIFDKSGTPILIGINSYGASTEGFLTNLAAHTDFLLELKNPKQTEKSVFFTYALNTTPSFACNARSRPVERAICGDLLLSQLDRDMVRVYQALESQLPQSLKSRLRSEQTQWLKQRNACKSDIACLHEAYNQRLDTLEGLQTALNR